MTERFVVTGKMPLWQERWPTHELERRHRAIGDRAWARGYENRAQADGDRTFSPVGESEPPWPIPSSWPRFMGLDLSGTERQGVALVGIALEPETLIRHVVWAGKAAGRASAIVALLRAGTLDMDPDTITVETNGVQGVILDWLRGSQDPALLAYADRLVPHDTTSRNKRDVELGLPGFALLAERGQVKFARKIRGTAGDLLRHELTEHPNGTTDDQVMALWFASMGCARWLDARVQAAEQMDVSESYL